MTSAAHTETALRVIGALLFVVGLAFTMLTVIQVVEAKRVYPTAVALQLSATLSPVLLGFLMWKAAKALEWMGEIREAVGQGENKA